MAHTTEPGGMDRLSSLLERFRVRAHLFHAGALCGVTHFDAKPGRAFLHVLRRGELTLGHRGGRANKGLPRQRVFTEPTLLFYPRAQAHQFHNPPKEGSDFVCATLDFEGGDSHPIVRALPPLVALPLAAVPGLDQTLDLLFAETQQLRCGQRLLADKLFEVLLLQLLRWMLDHPHEAGLPPGLLNGLAHPRLVHALVAVHDAPGQAWSLEKMAAVAGMSRSAFAAAFKQWLAQTPAQYLAQWRLSLACGLLREGQGLKAVAEQLGYASAPSLSRAFTQGMGVSPRAWRQAQQDEG
jgi:AraC-like DNA-binding protein